MTELSRVGWWWGLKKIDWPKDFDATRRHRPVRKTHDPNDNAMSRVHQIPFRAYSKLFTSVELVASSETLCPCADHSGKNLSAGARDPS